MSADPKDLEKLSTLALGLNNLMDGLIKETIKQKLVDTWNKFEPINDNLIKEIEKALEEIRKNKGELGKDREKSLDAAVKKWNDVSNVWGGLVTVEAQCSTGQDYWKKVEAAIKKV